MSTTKTQISGAEAVIKCLVEEGIDLIYGYPGGAIMPIYDALWHYMDKINHVLTRHEQGATHAAQGWARVNGKAAVCFATSGPGATNLITGIADAIMDSTPMICITGQVPMHLLGTDAFQETDVVGITMPITKWNYQITKAAEIPEILAKAFYIANSGKPGPVLIDITKNAQFEMMEWTDYSPCTSVRGYIAKADVNVSKIQQAAEIINSSKKPLIIAGQGVIISKSKDNLEKLSTKSGIPVTTTMQGLGGFNPDHPNYVGIPGMHGNYSVNIKMNECDVMIAIGMRFDDRVTGDVSKFAKQAKVIHIDIDPVEINKVVKTEVGISADAKEAIDVLLPYILEKNHEAWIQTFKDLDAQEEQIVIQPAIHPSSDGIKMGEIMHLIDNKTKGNAIIVPDVGQHQMYAMRYYNYRQPNSWVSSGGLGTMGFALPAAVGAQMAAPDRTVVAIIGDGCFQMTIQELGTIWQNNLNVKVVIFNNNYLGMVRQWQQLFFDNRYSQVELKNPDFVTIAKGFRLEAAKVEKREELSDALDKMFAHQGGYVLEVVVEKEENLFPMVPSGKACSDVILEP
ncbi:MAG TPA: biosynthetic-type acetolactate synthase large subunit [Chitinophagales bacterium]|jgi:acetolactate synthase-1/2/3 large subunit|nr:biosynthetic-type acetolactate synthase large subunit [Chitinophagales bacterium]MBP6153373.1 biosynthetic-type acetolactate synthase large subunit [Chitinophagales bacterium]HQV77450.1 biosynthetic-type acetolactate synthase large subunit [Chitinophagales bacterium]HQW78512.1 biosynthetic-type acetolactate synthase large subunit [Chitinophagales bacterium]HRB18667.1 biosynthetic-type acetolactate synthase large subunit [Chitinophagales bacterium]